MAAKSIFTTDHGHTIQRATAGLEAATKLEKTLELTTREQMFWDQTIGYWRVQLRFAEKKGRK